MSAYLDELTAAVANQQSESGYPVAPTEGEEKEENGSKVDYYAVAHRIKEVREQSRVFVGGEFKDYQKIRSLQWMVSQFNNHLNGILANQMNL